MIGHPKNAPIFDGDRSSGSNHRRRIRGNESAPQRHTRLQIPITAAYGTDHETVEKLVHEVCTECPLVRESPAPKLVFLEFGDSALVFERWAYIDHPLVEKRAIDRINHGVYEAFDDAGVTIPFPSGNSAFWRTARRPLIGSTNSR